MALDSDLVATNTDAWLRPGWFPVARSAEVADAPVRVQLLGEAWALARIDGAVQAFADRCPHRGARLSDGQLLGASGGGQVLQCPYHGWQFGADGSCRLVPALGVDAAPPSVRAASAACIERDGLVWLAPEDPVCEPLDSMPDDSGLRFIELPVVDVAATAAQIVDNFLDIAHFPFVHAATFGGGADERVDPFEVRTVGDGWGLVLEYHHTIANHEDPLVASGEHPLVQPRVMRYEYRVPFSATLRLELPVAGSVNVLALHCQPCDAETTRVYMSMARDDCGTPAAEQEAIDFEMRVFAEDVTILEHLPRGMPLAANAEAGTRADRLTAAYRRVLRNLATGSVTI